MSEKHEHNFDNHNSDPDHCIDCCAAQQDDLRSQLAQAKAELEVERKSREDYARLLDDLATAIDASNFAEAIALAKQYAFRLGDGGER